ncbi:MAG TPA: hypothetical protein VJU77_14965 [Chthoniobacterales bacterium]|nr:hypothetical protein [Chthoniobacterales bacterium]
MTRITLLLLLVCASATLSAGESPVRVTVQQLLVAPEKFVGKRVDVTGYYSVHAEDSQLYASSRAMSSGTVDDSIWLGSDSKEPSSYRRTAREVEEGRRVANRDVRVIGTFHYQPRPYLGKSVPYERRFQGFGSYRLNKRAILEITYIQPAH